jgi:hypothetical protein
MPTAVNPSSKQLLFRSGYLNTVFFGGDMVTLVMMLEIDSHKGRGRTTYRTEPLKLRLPTLVFDTAYEASHAVQGALVGRYKDLAIPWTNELWYTARRLEKAAQQNDAGQKLTIKLGQKLEQLRQKEVTRARALATAERRNKRKTLAKRTRA